MPNFSCATGSLACLCGLRRPRLPQVVRDFVASKKAAVEKILRAKAAAAAAAVGEAEEGTDTQAPPPALG